MNVWASERRQAENDPDSCCCSGQSVIVCCVEKMDKLFGGASMGEEAEVSEHYLKTDTFDIAAGTWAAVANRSNTCLTTTAGAIFSDARVLGVASVAAGYDL